MKSSHWDEAAKQSKFRRAVATFGLIQDRTGKMVKADIIIREGGDAKMVYHRTGRVIRPASAREVDSLTGWEPY